MHDKVSGAESWWSGLVTEVFEALTPCRARKPALCGTARRCPMKGLQIRVWSWSWSSNSKSCAAVAVCAQLPQMIERSAFVRSRRYSSSSLEHDSPADSKIVAGAAILVENGPRATGSIARAVWPNVAKTSGCGITGRVDGPSTAPIIVTGRRPSTYRLPTVYSVDAVYRLPASTA